MVEFSEFIICHCGEHAICVRKWEDEPLIELGFWQSYYLDERLNIWRRIKMAFRLLSKRYLYNDMVILGNREINKLMEVLEKVQKEL